MHHRASWWIALAGLFILIAVIQFPEPSAWSIIVSVPLLLLFFSGLKPAPRWGGWVAVAMVPYLCIALGESIADPADRVTGLIIVGCSIVVFFAAMDFVRKTGASLRR